MCFLHCEHIRTSRRCVQRTKLHSHPGKDSCQRARKLSKEQVQGRQHQPTLRCQACRPVVETEPSVLLLCWLHDSHSSCPQVDMGVTGFEHILQDLRLRIWSLWRKQAGRLLDSQRWKRGRLWHTVGVCGFGVCCLVSRSPSVWKGLLTWADWGWRQKDSRMRIWRRAG